MTFYVKACQFMLADNSHEMSSLIFSEKKKKKKNQNVVCAVVTGTLRINDKFIEFFFCVHENIPAST